MDTTILRHGDVCLIPCDLPESAKLEFTGTEFVVQEGEQTGHCHRLKSPSKFKVFTSNNVRYVQIEAPSTISHEEHKELVVSPGVYRQDQEIEKDWFSLSVRQVID
jgi:hypothetical protein